MNIQVEVTEVINILHYLDEDMVVEIMDEFGIKSMPEKFQDINFTDLSMNDNSKIELFIEKFSNVPITDLETFLNKY